MSQEKYPILSVVVCAYNGGNLIQSCLSGLVMQSSPSDRYEVLIIDDGSKDRTFDIVSDFIKSQNNNALHIRLARIQHGGLSVARNTGIHLSKGEIIAFIDQDAVPDQCWVAAILNAWEAVPDADAIGGRTEIRNAANRTANFLYTVYYEPMDRYGIFGTNMSFKKEKLLQVGAFGDPFISRGDETFLLTKMGDERKEVKWPEARLFHDWPVSLRQWLKERISNGEMFCLISRILYVNKSVCTTFLIRRLFIVILFAVALCIAWKALWGLLLLTGVSLAVKRRESYIMLREKHSFGVALLLTLGWQLLSEAGMWMFCLGCWRGKRMPLVRASAMTGTVSDEYIIQEIATYNLSP